MPRVLMTAALAIFLTGGLAAQAQDQGVYQIGNGVTAPVLTKEVKPKYTEGAMRRKVEGVVEMSVVVKKDGTTGDIYVTRSLDSELDVQAMNAVGEWEFRPGTKDGQPVNVRVSVELTFTLKK